MEFTREIGSFQGAIISADNVHQFSTINSKGGNEEKVHFVIESIKRFLKMERYIDDNGLIEAKESSTRQFAMYIVLNSDLPVLDDMMEVTELEPMIWSIPTVSKYLMCEMIWQLHLEKFIYELIPACWPQMGLEVAEAFLVNFKYLSPTECLHSLYKLSTACYALICRLGYFKYRDDSGLSNTMTAALANFEKCLKYYINPPNKHRLDTLSTDESYKYKGIRLKTLLCLVYDCFDMFTQNINTNNDDPIYKLTYHVDYLYNINCKVYESPNTMVVECLNNSNIMLLDIFQEIVMDVSVNIFCSWSEYEEGDGKSFQQTIGELCHQVQEKLESISLVAEHPVISMIRLMARKPTAIKDVINSTDAAIILEKIKKNDDNSSSWMRGLAYYDNLHQEPALLQIVNSNLNIYNSNECYKLHNVLEKIAMDNVRDGQSLSDLRHKVMNKCDIEDQQKIIKAHFKDQIFFDDVRNENDFESDLNTMFNKFDTNMNVQLNNVLTAFYQSPRQVLKKIFNVATQNSKLIETMLSLMLLLKDYTKYYYNTETEPCMVKIMKLTLINNCEFMAYSNNIIKFICKLKETDIIESNQLLILVIMPSIHTALVSRNIKRLQTQVLLLIDAYTMEELESYRAPMLVMVAQIMEMVRVRNLGKFQSHAVQTLELAIRFQKSVINTYRDVIPDSEGSWLRHKVRDLNLHHFNGYYFKSLWNVDNKSFFDSLIRKRLQRNITFNELTIQLTKLLPFTTLEEWCMIWDDIVTVGIKDTDALRVMHSAVAALCESINNNRTEGSRGSLLYYYTNLMHIMRYKLLTEPLSSWHVKNCVAYLAKNLSTTHPDDVSEIETIIMPFLAYLNTRKHDYSVDIIKYFKATHYYNIVRIVFDTDYDEEHSMD